MKQLLLSLLLAVPLAAQVGTFHTPATGTLNSSTATTLTIQQPASGAKSVTFVAATATCAGQSYTTELRYNGTAASSTSAIIVPMLTSGTSTPTTTAWSASNVGSGSSLGSILPWTAGSIASYDLTKPGASLIGSGTAKNFSIILTNTGVSSCTYTLDVIWSER